ncbi:flagellar hook-associated protein FlgL [Atopomonas sediminilitoris]|uniref:flagellar hook-associated protein FlgL n=1 Tax=Atopomonas sediminilitoris TaxID=2919919 RepID=UPI001F4D5ADE|nr:flagellar hook-associated protein FlgL [Atopomonas sediminilitoris]MCJ8167962.1 flagellar hook-associated protein FlgL [Atopomonas sediminilitoris]
MRISTVQAFNNAISGLQRNYADLTRSQEQISTGKRILTPADDPVAAARLLQLEQEKSLYDQYQSNLTAAQNSLTQEESILTSVGNVMQRVREIAIQAGDGAQDATDKAALAKELQEREEELLNLLNSRNARGEYLFAGNVGKTQPFIFDGTNAAGPYLYQGDEGQREIQIASSTFVPINDNGKALFENSFNANRVTTAATGTNTGTGRISLGLVEDKLAYDTVFPRSATGPAAGDGVGIRFTSAVDYEIYDLADPLLPGSYTPLANGQLDDNPDGSDTIRYGGVRVEFDDIPAAGDDFTINRNPALEKRSILNSVYDLRIALENAADNPEGNKKIRDSVAVAITNVDETLGKVLEGQGAIGARLNVVESTEFFNQDVTLINQGVQSDLRDLDYADALSRLSYQEIILQASQQSFVRISSLSLFDVLR